MAFGGEYERSGVGISKVVIIKEEVEVLHTHARTHTHTHTHTQIRVGDQPRPTHTRKHIRTLRVSARKNEGV